MRKATGWILILVFALMLSGCQQTVQEPPTEPTTEQNEPNLGNLAEQLLKVGKFPEMLALSSSRLSKFYDIEASLLDSFAIYVCAEAIISDEIILVRAKNESDIKDIQKKIGKRLATQKESFDSYLPAEGEKIAQVVSHASGRDLVYIVCAKDQIEPLSKLIVQAYQNK